MAGGTQPHIRPETVPRDSQILNCWIHPIHLRVRGEDWAGGRDLTAAGFHPTIPLPAWLFRFSQQSPRCCDYFFPHFPMVSKSCDQTGPKDSFATSVKHEDSLSPLVRDSVIGTAGPELLVVL